MNDPTHPVAAKSPDYGEDSYGWALAQADLVRQRKLAEIDWDNLLEEIEEMARSQYRALESALRVLLLHLLKWNVQPAFRSRSWLLGIDEHGRRYRRILEDNPSLRQHLDKIRREAHASARRLASAETGFDIKKFPKQPLGWNAINNPPVHEDNLSIR